MNSNVKINAKHRSMIGRWKLERSSDTFDDYLKEIGMNPVKRKIALVMKPNLQVEINGEMWTSKVESMLKSMQWSFTPGEKFKAKTVDGRLFWVTIVLGEDGTVTEIQENIDDDKHVPSKITRFVDQNDNLIAVCQANNVEARRIYSRINE